jgi:hypothetical protein
MIYLGYTKKAKMYEGYLLFEYKLDTKLIYKMQIDFLDKEGRDIGSVMECSLKSLWSL